MRESEMQCMLSHFSHLLLFATLWTIDHQAPVSMGFSRQEYWSGLPCPSPVDLPNPGISWILLCFLHWQEGFFTTSDIWGLQKDSIWVQSQKIIE